LGVYRFKATGIFFQGLWPRHAGGRKRQTHWQVSAKQNHYNCRNLSRLVTAPIKNVHKKQEVDRL
ncbi:MAG TPA: hypothetical protein VJJ98_10350, partial [Sedimentisphaerales bacterium]|nr:hypothetical protein [Sedimentisphaerales bacterium]